MIYGLILGAGKGTRFGKEKQTLILKNKPVYQYSIDSFLNSRLFDQIYFVCPAGKSSDFQLKDIYTLEGGKERYDSVKNALSVIQNKNLITDQDWIIIQDSARPLIKTEYLTEICSELKHFPAVTLGYKITDALKNAQDNGIIKSDVNRANIWAVTTPQGFHIKTLIRLYNQSSHFLYDETHLFIQEKLPVKIIEKGRYNLKITYQEDFNIVEKLI